MRRTLLTTKIPTINTFPWVVVSRGHISKQTCNREYTYKYHANTILEKSITHNFYKDYMHGVCNLQKTDQ